MKTKLSILILLVLTLSILSGCFAGQKEIVRIDVGDALPRQFEYGSTPDFSGISVTIVYNDESTKTITAADLQFSTIDTTKPGKQNLTITYSGYTQTFEVEVLKKPSSDNTPTRELESIQYVSGIPSVVYVGDTFQYEKLTIQAIYNDGTKETISLGTNTNVKHSVIDTAKAGKQTLTFTYMNKTCETVVSVEEIKVVKIEIDYRSVMDGVDKDTIKVTKLYNNGASFVIKNDELSISLEGDVYTITYVDEKDGTFTATIDSSKTPVLETIEILTTGYEDVVILAGDTFNASGVTCKAIYSNGASITLTQDEFSATLDTSVAGAANLVVTYVDNEEIKATKEMKILGISKIDIDTATVKTKIPAGTVLDLTDIKLVITCTDGTIVVRPAASVDTSNLSTDEINDSSYITATYNGVTSEQLKIYVTDPNASYFIIGAELPSALTSVSNKKTLFKDQGYAYFVGDDNPFILKMIVSALDENDEEVSANDIHFRSYYELYLDGNQLTNENIATYVSIDPVKHSLDFTEAAIGKTFKIVVAPEGRESELSSEITVEVVDGFNIYEAWELNYLTNMNNFPGDTNLGKLNQVDLVNTFLADEKGVDIANKPKNLAGLILHSDMIVKPSDLPKEYFLGKDRTQEFWENIAVFPHATDSATGEFTFYGNYFTIHTYMLPNVCKDGTGNQDHSETPTGVAVSNSPLFRFASAAGNATYDKTIKTDAELDFDHTDYKTTLKCLYLRDDNPMNDEEWKADRALRGLIGMKVCYQVVDLENVNIEAFYIGVLLDYDYVTVNVKNSILYNAYQNHFYIWNENEMLDDKNAVPGANHQPITLNITSSDVTRSGGPVILAMTDDPGFAKNANSHHTVNISKDSEIWTFVTGSEVWFTVMGQTATVSDIINLGGYYSAYVPGSNGKSFITNTGEREDLKGNYINLVMAYLSADYDGADIDCSYNVIDGSTTQTYLDMNDTNGNYGNPYVSGFVAATAGKAPVLQTVTGGVVMVTTNPATDQIVNGDKLDEGDYIAIYQQGMGILLGFNINDQIERLPAPNQ